MNEYYSWVRKFTVAAIFAAATVALAGCAGGLTGTGSKSDSSVAAEIAAQKDALARKEAALEQLRIELEAERAQLSQLGEQGAADSMTVSANDNSSLIPPEPKPGECYARVLVYPQYATIAEPKLKKEAGDRIEITPARYETVYEDVLVKEASTRLEVIPAKYETVQEQVLVKPAITKLEAVPAVYEEMEVEMLVEPAVTETIEVPAEYKTVHEKVVIPEHTEWKLVSDLDARGRAASSSAAQVGDRIGGFEVLETRIEDTGDLMCLVVIPRVEKTFEKQVLVKPASTITRTVREPVYKTVKRTVLKEPAREREITIPAEYRTVDVVKLVRPATTREIVIPAEYDKVPVRKLVAPAQERRVEIPAEFEQVTRREKVSDLRTEWRSVLCDLNMTRDNVKALQTKLNEKGVCRCGSSGRECAVDGVAGKCTWESVKRYAQQKRLSSGNNYVTMEVIEDLGLDFSIADDGG